MELEEYCRSGNTEEVYNYLIGKRVSQTTKDYCLSIAKNKNVMKLIFDHDTNLQKCDNSTFVYACTTGNLKIARSMYSRGVDIHTDNNKAFIEACHGGHTEVVRFLIEAGADPKCYSNIMYGICWNYSCCCYNIRHESDMHDDYKRLMSNCVKVAKLLLEHQCDINSDNCLYVATKCGGVDLVEPFLSYGVNDANLQKTFKQICVFGHIEVANLLIIPMCERGLFHSESNELLQYLCGIEEDRHQIVRLLLNHGAKIQSNVEIRCHETLREFLFVYNLQFFFATIENEKYLDASSLQNENFWKIQFLPNGSRRIQ